MIVKSLFSKIRGSAGGITVSNWKGKQVAKERITTNASKSPAQIFQRARFAYIVAFMFLFGQDLVKGIWARFERQTTYLNEFTSPNVKAQPAYVDDVTPFVGVPDIIQFSKGTLETLANVVDAVYTTLTGGVEVAWDDTILGNGQLTDTVFLLVLDSEHNFKYVLPAVTRADKAVTGTIKAGLTLSNLLFVVVTLQTLLDGSDIYADSFQAIPTV